MNDQGPTWTLQVAWAHIQAGRRGEAVRLLVDLLKRNLEEDNAWYLLSYALEDRAEQIHVLQRALAINPDNQQALRRLQQLGGLPVEVEEIPRAQEEGPLALGIDTPRAPGGVPTLRQGPEPWVVLDLGVRHSRRAWLMIRVRLLWRRFRMNWEIFAQSRLALLGLALIVLFGLGAIAHPLLMKFVWPRGIYDPVTGFDMNVFPHPSPPGPGHLLGTDTLGRDVLSMLLAATTPTFVIGLTAALTTAVIGTLLGVLAAYFRGAVDTAITNLADVFILFPAPIVMVIIGARFRDLGPVPLGMVYGLITGAGATTIVLRAHALQVVSRPFMEAARVAGGSGLHIIARHLIPSVLPLAALQMMIAVSGVVVADGFISFFGLTRLTSNWGTLIYDAFVYTSALGRSEPLWHVLVPAALCFTLFAMGFYLVSRGLHRVAAPGLRPDLR